MLLSSVNETKKGLKQKNYVCMLMLKMFMGWGEGQPYRVRIG